MMNPLEVQTHYNPNLPAQLAEWQRLREERGQDSCIWAMARAHILALGAPEPGNIDLLPYVPGSRCGVVSTPSKSPEWLMPVGIIAGAVALVLLLKGKSWGGSNAPLS